MPPSRGLVQFRSPRRDSACPAPFRGQAPTIVGIAHAGAGAALFADWAADLPEWLGVLAVRLPGRESRLRDAPRRDLGELAAETAEDLGGWFTEHPGPFALYGHCFGALLGFDAIKCLSQVGDLAPTRLFAASCMPPSLVGKLPAISHLRGSQLQESLTAFGPPVPEELMALCEPAIRADLHAMEHRQSRFDDVIDAPITVFRGSYDAAHPIADLLHWRTHTRGSFEFRQLAARHHLLPEGKQALLGLLISALSADHPAQSGPS